MHETDCPVCQVCIPWTSTSSKVVCLLWSTGSTDSDFLKCSFLGRQIFFNNISSLLILLPLPLCLIFLTHLHLLGLNLILCITGRTKTLLQDNPFEILLLHLVQTSLPSCVGLLVSQGLQPVMVPIRLHSWLHFLLFKYLILNVLDILNQLVASGFILLNLSLIGH